MVRWCLKMNEHRKKIILSEIKYWKQKKLLPAHYCDFLIMLYAGGDEEEEEEVKVSTSFLSREKKKQKWGIAIFLLLTMLLSASLFIFKQYSMVLLSVSAIVLAIFLLYPIFNPLIRKSIIFPFIYISSAMLLLAMSFKIWNTFFSEQPMLLMGLLILNCALWLWAGRLLKLLYFTISGATGLLLIVGFLIFG